MALSSFQPFANFRNTSAIIAIIGISNLPSLLASDATALYSRNILNFVELLITKDEGEFVLNREDEIVEETLVCLNGKPR